MQIFLQLAAALVLVVVASDAFTNAVEWIGARFGLTRSAIGAVVAAIGSSLPETTIAIVALLVLRDPRSQQVGIGAVLGAPLMLSTMVFFLIGVVALVRPKTRERALAVPIAPVLFGTGLFAATFALALAASFVRTSATHFIVAVLIVVSYGLYLFYHLHREQPQAEESPPPLRIAPRQRKPVTAMIALQIVIALGVTVFASRWFVVSAARASTALGLSPFIVSLFLSPIATELPEASNVVLWMRRGEDNLALGNVLGAMMFQTSIACAIAMWATPWQLGSSAYAAGGASLAAAVLLIATTLVRRRVEPKALVACGLFYAAYALFAVRL